MTKKKYFDLNPGLKKPVYNTLYGYCDSDLKKVFFHISHTHELLDFFFKNQYLKLFAIQDQILKHFFFFQVLKGVSQYVVPILQHPQPREQVT